MRFLLDTNVLSEPLKPAPNPGIQGNLIRFAGEIAIAAPVWHEALFGLERMPTSRRRRALEAYLHDFVRIRMPILAYDAAAAEWHAAERARLTRVGRVTPYTDSQIAAIAVTNGLELVTINHQDFRGFHDLKLVDWRT